MKLLLLALTLFLAPDSLAFSKKRPVIVEPTPTPVIVVTPSPDSSGSFATLGTNIGSSVDKAFAQKAIGYLNKAISSGCVKEKIIPHAFLSLKNIDGLQVKNNLEAYDRYVKGAPYALDVRWYYKRLSSTIGYTYNYLDGASSGKTETKIWSNTKYLDTEKDYASHLAHELSHQSRAGAFVHYSFHQGSFPYEIGDIVWECVLGY